MKIEALWVVEPNRIEVLPVELPPPKHNEIQVQTKAVGICAWDSYLFRGMDAPKPCPYRIGHEGVGIITDIGEDVKSFNIGDKIFVGSGGDEMMATYFNVASDCVAKIPKDEDDYVKWVGEPVVCVVNILDKTNIQPGDSVALIGAGYMGILTLQGLIRGSQAGSITVFDIDKSRLSIAEEYSSNSFDIDSEEGKNQISKIQLEGGAKIVIEFAGNQEALDLATSLAANEQGKLVIGAWHRGLRTFDGNKWHKSGLEVLNLAPKSNLHFNELTPGTANLIEKGVYDTKRLVTHTAKFGNMEDMYTIFQKSIKKSDGYIKGVILFD